MVNDSQVRLYRRKRLDGLTQAAAAAAVGIGERTGRKWESRRKDPRTPKYVVCNADKAIPALSWTAVLSKPILIPS